MWLREHRHAREEGSKDRPCAIMLTVQGDEGAKRVLVVPVTHATPSSSDTAIELPPAIKRHLGLDAQRSWVVLSESNVFDWPGPDIRRADQGDESTVAYGFLPPRFFAELRRRFLALETMARSRRVRRTD